MNNKIQIFLSTKFKIKIEVTFFQILMNMIKISIKDPKITIN